MSQMIPQATADVLRLFNDISVDIYGIECTVYIPTNLDTTDRNSIYSDVYERPQDRVFDEYPSKVFIEMSPSIHRLRKLGIYSQDEAPMIAYFSNILTTAPNSDNPDGISDYVPIIVHSWFSIPVQFIPDGMDTNEFEIVDVLIRGVHDKVVLKAYKIAPRRVRGVSSAS